MSRIQIENVSKLGQCCSYSIRFYVLQSKEAGADDILDISGCELSEVGGDVLLMMLLHLLVVYSNQHVNQSLKSIIIVVPSLLNYLFVLNFSRLHHSMM